MRSVHYRCFSYLSCTWKSVHFLRPLCIFSFFLQSKFCASRFFLGPSSIHSCECSRAGGAGVAGSLLPGDSAPGPCQFMTTVLWIHTFVESSEQQQQQASIPSVPTSLCASPVLRDGRQLAARHRSCSASERATTACCLAARAAVDRPGPGHVYAPLFRGPATVSWWRGLVPVRFAPAHCTERCDEHYSLSGAAVSFVSSAVSWTSMTFSSRRCCSLPWSLCVAGLVRARSTAWHFWLWGGVAPA